jgi:membrane protease YdiL (CAAX protease family)
MGTQLEKTTTPQPSWLNIMGEILLVFSPALVLINVTSSWAGSDPVRKFGVIWIVNMIILLIVWLFVKRRNQSWAELGLTFNWPGWKEGAKIFGLSLIVFVFGIAAYLSGPLLLSGFMDAPESADFTRYEYMKDNPVGLIVSLLGVYIVSSFGEEVVFRAFLIDRISTMTRSTGISTVLAVIFSSLLFGIFHYEWGLMGVVQTTMMGLAMGISYVVLKRKLWVLILAHAYMDTLLLVGLYMASNS